MVLVAVALVSMVFVPVVIMSRVPFGMPLAMHGMLWVGKIPVIAAVADGMLVVVADIPRIAGVVVAVVHPWLGLIDNYLMGIVKVEGAVAWRQFAAGHPYPAIHINIFLCGYIIVGINVGDVIIVNMVVANRPPKWLQVNVHAYLCLCRQISGYCECGKQKKFSHSTVFDCICKY